MRLLLIESSPDFCRVLENVLARGEIRVQSVSDPRQASAVYSKHAADLVLVDLPVEVDPVEDFLTGLRSHPGGSTVPVVLMSEVHHKDSKVVSRITETFQTQEFLPRPFEMFGIARRLRAIGEASPRAPQGPPSVKAPPARPVPKPARPRPGASQSRSANFRTLLGIWQGQKSGILREAGDSGWVSLYSGGLQSDSDQSKVQALLDSDQLEFCELHQDGEGDPSRLAKLLWREAQSHVPLSFEIQLEKRFIGLTDHARLLDQLPISEATQEILERSSPHSSTRVLLDELNLSTEDILLQLGALRSLGVVHLKPAQASHLGSARPPSPARHATRPRRRPNSPPNLQGQTSHAPSPALLLKRLQSEFKRLQTADPYTILGVPRGCGPDLLHGATQRMESRYSMQSRDPSLPKEARAIAAKLARMVVEAESEILTSQSKPPTRQSSPAKEPQPTTKEPSSIEELAFSEGTKAFAAGDYKRATQCFRKARDERIDSVRNLSWLGWAVYHHPSLPDEERIEESTDLLRLAVSFDPANRQAQFFLAYIESATGQVESAMSRLQSLVKVHPDHKEAKRLLHMLVKRST